MLPVLRQVIELEPAYIDASLALVSVLHAQGKTRDALALLEQLKAAGASKIFSGVRRQPWLFLPQRAIATVESDYVVHRHLKRGRLVAALPPQRRRVG